MFFWVHSKIETKLIQTIPLYLGAFPNFQCTNVLHVNILALILCLINKHFNVVKVNTSCYDKYIFIKRQKGHSPAETLDQHTE